MSPSQFAVELRAILPELTRFARYLAATADDAEELVQETLTRALRGGSELERAGSLKAWVFTIARHGHVDMQRARASRDRFVVLGGGLEELSALESPPPQLGATVERADLERVLGELAEGARAALLLSDLWEFDLEEIAKILDIPVGTVKSRVARARAHVAAALGRHADEGRRGA
jgi:RNA polymerase sigma-70 factor (ECF subfamily)